jgi:hypothetical protein
MKWRIRNTYQIWRTKLDCGCLVLNAWNRCTLSFYKMEGGRSLAQQPLKMLKSSSAMDDVWEQTVEQNSLQSWNGSWNVSTMMLGWWIEQGKAQFFESFWQILRNARKWILESKCFSLSLEAARVFQLTEKVIYICCFVVLNQGPWKCGIELVKKCTFLQFSSKLVMCVCTAQEWASNKF